MSSRRSVPVVGPVHTTQIQLSNLENRTKQTKLFQQQPYPNSQPWGDTLSVKASDDIRIAFRNINSFPIHSKDSRNLEFINDIYEGGFDIFGLTETNVAWNKLDRASLPAERFRGKFEAAHWTYSNHNQDAIDNKAIQQSGGTLMVCTNQLCHRVICSGKDPMGRWSWIMLRGKGEMKLGILTMYRAVRSTGELSAYRQQQRTLNMSNDDSCPRESVFTDIFVLVEDWKKKGIQIILMGDFNSDVSHRKFKEKFDHVGLHEIFCERHGSQPNTHIRGTNPIDGIFVTSSIHPSKCGYTEFDWGMHSDHRLLWMDINASHTFGTLHPTWIPRARRLKLIDPRIVQKFLKLRANKLESSSLPARIGFLQQSIKRSGMTPTNCRLLESIDRDRVKHILYAERKCRKLSMGNIAWSPQLQQSICHIRYLRLCIHKFRGSCINSRTLFLHHKRCQSILRPVSLLEAVQLLKKEFEIYNLIRKDASALRHDFLLSLAQAKSLNNEGNSITIYNVMLAREKARLIARTIRLTIKASSGGLCRVEAPDALGKWQLWDKKQDIEQRCMEENIARFTQANHTPPLLDDQRRLLGWTANTITSTSILDGVCDFSSGDLHPDLQRTLKYFKRSTQIPNISSCISCEEYQYRWSRCREFTSTGVSGLHMGHFRASCLDNSCAWVDRILCEIPLQTGYSLSRWQTCIDVMIPKKKDSLKVTKLRTICLMEADFNFINKLIGRRALANAEDFNDIAIEQFGSRKAKSAIIHAINKQLVFDIARQRKQAVALLVLDAKSCYDRIAPPIASLALKRWGMAQSNIDMLFNSISNMSHYIRTSYGNSADTYSQQDTPFHGVLQGNGAGPAIWVAVSSPLLDRMRAEGCGLQMSSINKAEVKQIVGFAFVDDCDLLQSLPDNEDDDLKVIQHSLDTWVESLRSTGGTLVPEKSNWFKMRFVWKRNKWKIRSSERSSTQPELQMINDSGRREAIQQLDANASILALGVQFSPSGQMKDQFQVLKGKASAWAESVRCGHLRRHEAWQALITTVFKTIEFPLPSTTLSFQQCDDIVSPILTIGLPAAGICRHISRNVAFSSITYKGLGLKHPFFTQGIHKLILLLDANLSLTNTLLQDSMEFCAYECGLGHNFLLSNFFDYKRCITHGWIASLWEFLTYYQVTIFHTSNTQLIHECRIMQHIASIPHDQQGLFNHCRLYLNLEFETELFTSDFKKIRQSVWNGTVNMPMVMSTVVNKPPTPRPSHGAWNMWRYWLQTIWKVNARGCCKADTLLPQSVPTAWKWFYNSNEGRLYEKHLDNTVSCFTPTNISQRQSSRLNKLFQYAAYETTSVCHFSQFKCFPVTIFQRDDKLFQIEGSLLQGISTINSDTSTLNMYSWQDDISTTLHGTFEELLASSLSASLIAVSDGSVISGKGTAAWIITTNSAWSQGCYISGVSVLPKEVEQLDSHRAELFGLLGINFTLQQYFGKSTPRTIQYSCDNMSALFYAFDTIRYPQAKSTFPDYDLIQSIRCSLPKNWIILHEHVKGHQDNTTTKLTFLETLNVFVDQLANTACKEAQQQSPLQNSGLHIVSSHICWQVKLNGLKIVKNLQASVYEYISERSMRSYVAGKNMVTVTAFPGIDWSANGIALASLQPGRRHWMTKHTFGFCGVNATLKKWGIKASSVCTRCGQIETTTHVWQCQHVETQKCWTQFLHKLQIWLNEQYTQPSLVSSLLDHLSSWSQQQEGRARFPRTQAESAQDFIGWEFLLEGMISRTWSDIQTTHYTKLGMSRTGLRWLTQLLLKFWGICWDLWNIRNEWEHKMKLEANAERIRQQVEEMIHQGFHDLPNLANIYSVNRLEIIRKSSTVYQKAWLLNLAASRKRAQRKSLSDQDIRGMQTTLISFLRQQAPT